MSAEHDVAAWAKAHQACFETEPLEELREGAMVQVGFVLQLHARLPMDKAPGKERREAAVGAWEGLRSTLESVLPPERKGFRIEIEPMRAAVVLRPENEMQPEVSLRARVFHDDDTWKAVSPDDRQRVSAFEKQLLAIGLKAGHW